MIELKKRDWKTTEEEKSEQNVKHLKFLDLNSNCKMYVNSVNIFKI